MTCPAGYGENATLSLARDPEKHFHSDSDTTVAPLPPITLDEPAAEPKIFLDIMPEPIVLFTSGEYAILLQWLKYGLAGGSVGHSGFGARVFQRVITTVRYLNTIVYGTRQQKETITGWCVDITGG